MMSAVLPSLALCLSMLAVPLQEVQKPPLRENVESTVAEALRLLEAKEYRTLLLEFFPPEWVKEKLAEPGGLDAWVDMFVAHSLQFVLPKLKEASTLTPTYDEAKTTATYQLQRYDGSKRFDSEGRPVLVYRTQAIELSASRQRTKPRSQIAYWPGNQRRDSSEPGILTGAGVAQ